MFEVSFLSKAIRERYKYNDRQNAEITVTRYKYLNLAIPVSLRNCVLIRNYVLNQGILISAHFGKKDIYQRYLQLKQALYDGDAAYLFQHRRDDVGRQFGRH